jgi:hypothetical protein
MKTGNLSGRTTLLLMELWPLALIFFELRLSAVSLMLLVPCCLLLADSWLNRRPPHERIANATVGAALAVFMLAGVQAFGSAVQAGSTALRATPETLDGVLHGMDRALGFDGFAVSRWLLRHPRLDALDWMAYLALPTAFALAWVAERSAEAAHAVLAGAVLCGPLYLLVPACGPKYAFAGWPWGDSSAVPAPYAAPRNCMPSMHVAWAAVLALSARSWRTRLLFGAFALATCVATIGTGEHYVVDVIGGLAFSVILRAASAAIGKRFPAAVGKRPPAGVKFLDEADA